VQQLWHWRQRWFAVAVTLLPKAKSNAAPAPKAKAAPKARPSNRHTHDMAWAVVEYDVVYISKVRRCDASFIIFPTAGSRRDPFYLKITLSRRFFSRFRVYDENILQYFAHRIHVKVPMNEAASDMMGNGDLGVMTSYVSRSPCVLSKSRVEALAAAIGYPLDGSGRGCLRRQARANMYFIFDSARDCNDLLPHSQAHRAGHIDRSV
jgi:hypothetical protein